VWSFLRQGFKAILPSRTDLYRTAKPKEAVAHDIVPYTRFSTPAGEGIKFGTIKVILVLIKSYGLEEVAKHRPIEVCSSADAAPVTKSVGVLTQGISFNDRGAILGQSDPCD
jgi:hypothetical protein